MNFNNCLKCIAVIKMGWKQSFQYKTHMIVTLVSGALPIIGIYYLWNSVYQNQPIVLEQYYTFNMLLTYSVSAFLLNMLMSTFGLEWEISDTIFEGNLTRFLIYPFAFILYWFSNQAGEKIFSFLLKLPLIVVILFLIKPNFIFPSLVNFLLFIMCAILAHGIYFLLSMIIGLSAFWWHDVTGFFYLGSLVIAFCSGLMLPLDLFPKSIQSIIEITPFYYILYFPLNIYLQKISLMMILKGYLIQVFWLFILYYAYKILFMRGLEKYEAAGG